MSIYIETNGDSLFKYGEELCGDKVEIVRTDEAVTVVLADGLGSGVKANILASLTSKIAATMLSQGAEIADVVETIASTLPVCKERGVAYSTFTMLRIFENGETQMVEFDNPEAIVLRRGKVLELEKNVFEIDGKTIKESRFVQQPGDVCVMFSDGAIHAGVGMLLNFGWQRENILDYILRAYKPGMTARAITKLMLAACDSLYMEKPGDDTTFVTTRFRRAEPAYIMVGPPVEKGRDSEIVSQFLEAQGMKVICGGTTSQIVSRVSGKQIRVKLEYISPDVPPTAQMEGVDLVTEGVITLGKAYDIISKYCTGEGKAEEAIPDLDLQDGASRLAKLLLEQCTEAHFYVGRALNPAHQNPDMSIDLSIKLRLVEDIAKALRGLGKKVTVAYN